MSLLLPISNIKRSAPNAVLAGLLNENTRESTDAGVKLVSTAKQYGLSMRDYLRLAIDPTKVEPEDHERFKGLNGYEAALCYLNLPVRDDFDAGVTLQLASDTFQTFPGTRSLFPDVVDDMLIWKYRQDNFEQISALISNSRIINGAEMISTVVDDKPADYAGTRPIAELANIPIRSIKATQKAVSLYKHGSAYRTSYEFSRRASLDLLVPFAARMGREFERSKVGSATHLLVNGDGTTEHGAAPVVNQSSLVAMGQTITAGQLNYRSLLEFLVKRAKAGTPVDTMLGNWDAYLQWLVLFAVPQSGAGDTTTAARNMAAAGVTVGSIPVLNGAVNFALSSTMEANQLLGFSKSDTIEELVEANSIIEEQSRAPLNQSITYVRTENSGYKFSFGDTRAILAF
jgi:hypothetical protein